MPGIEPASDLPGLEQQLRDLSHSTDALQTVRRFAESLKNTKARQAVFNAEGALILCPPITYAAARERELIPEGEDVFALLQGDVVSTDAAYHMGNRLTGGMHFLLANSTCDLMSGRRDFAALLPLQAIVAGDTDAERADTKQLLAELLRFASTRRMYLPPLPGDPSNILGNIVEFDRIAQARLDDVVAAHRIASLSLVGWRIFGSHLRALVSRTGDSEVAMRNAWHQAGVPMPSMSSSKA